MPKMVPPFQSCIHTCPHDTDYMELHSRRKRANGCPIIHTSGNTYSNHIRSQKAHTHCTNLCLGFGWLGLPKGSSATPGYKYRDPTHEEWVAWGVVLYQNLTIKQQPGWPQYYRPMVTDPSNPTPPPPLPTTNIWTTLPSEVLPSPAEPQTPQPLVPSGSRLPPGSAFSSPPQNSPIAEAIETDPLRPRYLPPVLEREISKGFRVIFVEDISHTHRHPGLKLHEELEWSLGNVPDEFAQLACSRCPGNIKKASSRERERGNFWMRDFLFYAIEMINRGWQVDVMPWSIFFEATRRKSGDAWAALLQQDMVVGGADLSTDYMNPLKRFEFTSKTRFHNYVGGVSELSKTVHVWPHPRDLLLGGRKIIQLRNHSQVAKAIPPPFGPLSYPITLPIASLNDLQGNQAKNIVVKREYSGCGETVIFGTDPDFATKVRRGMQETEENWSLLGPEFTPTWFAQPLLPTMKEKSEARIFFVGGIPLAGTVTAMTPQSQVEGSLFVGAIPLAKLLPGSHANVGSVKNFQTREYYDAYDASAPYDLLEDGKKELYQFATTMLKGLIRNEEAIYQKSSGHHISGLRFFARLDVGILHVKETNKFTFWLNEVERGHNTGLFTKFVGETGLTLASSLVDCWQSWMAHKRLDRLLGCEANERS